MKNTMPIPYSVKKHFDQLNQLAVGNEEREAIQELNASYLAFVNETSSIVQSSTVAINRVAAKKPEYRP